MSKRNSCYRSKIIKAGALIPDTKVFLTNWDPALSWIENKNRFKRNNIFGKSSRSRTDDILAIFKQRYMGHLSITKALALLTKSRMSETSIERIYYYHSALSDLLIHDTVVNLLYPKYKMGRTDISVPEIGNHLIRWIAEGKTTSSWSEHTRLRVAQGLLSTLRDFGLLQGMVNKTIAPIFLPLDSFAYIAFLIHKDTKSGDMLIQNPEWRLFLLIIEDVERLFIKAHQEGYLEYYAAGDVIRIEFPEEDIVEYAKHVAKRAN